MEKKASWFYRRFLNSKFTTAILNLLLVLLVVWVFTKIAWVFEPVMAFLRVVAPPFIFAGVLFYLLNPLVIRLTRFGVKRVWAIAIVLLAVLALLIIAVLKFVPTVERQFTNILQSYPTYWHDFTTWLIDLNDHQDLISQRDLEQIGNELMTAINDKRGTLAASTVAQLQNLVGIVGNVVVTVATAPIILFFMLKDGDEFAPKLVALFPVKLRASIHQMLHEMNAKVGSYVQGQLTVAMAVALIFMVGYSLIGLRFALVLGLIAGPLNLIPYFGSALAMVPALIVGAVTSPKMLIAVIITFFVEWLLETQLISPLVMGSKLAMHPITIVIVLLTAGNLFGLAGVILGIPGFAVIKIVVTRFFSWYQQVSGLYEETKE
ncbi:AI-2E family transporter [Lacticaseibacillus baoqingensis]|uniref:AI-2E family transporter n=1 Tax=Lacticaseibacillus baoqingensis TaxID=2486013 RepID=A0ABW4E610_9LACO|nr:AI-2E family transporter [Lacticaseibacillus baoqingensis]